MLEIGEQQIGIGLVQGVSGSESMECVSGSNTSTVHQQLVPLHYRDHDVVELVTPKYMTCETDLSQCLCPPLSPMDILGEFAKDDHGD